MGALCGDSGTYGCTILERATQWRAYCYSSIVQARALDKHSPLCNHQDTRPLCRACVVGRGVPWKLSSRIVSAAWPTSWSSPDAASSDVALPQACATRDGESA